jgi:hypothetical protein
LSSAESSVPSERQPPSQALRHEGNRVTKMGVFLYRFSSPLLSLAAVISLPFQVEHIIRGGYPRLLREVCSRLVRTTSILAAVSASRSARASSSSLRSKSVSFSAARPWRSASSRNWAAVSPTVMRAKACAAFWPHLSVLGGCATPRVPDCRIVACCRFRWRGPHGRASLLHVGRKIQPNGRGIYRCSKARYTPLSEDGIAANQVLRLHVLVAPSGRNPAWTCGRSPIARSCMLPFDRTSSMATQTLTSRAD